LIERVRVVELEVAPRSAILITPGARQAQARGLRRASREQGLLQETLALMVLDEAFDSSLHESSLFGLGAVALASGDRGTRRGELRVVGTRRPVLETEPDRAVREPLRLDVVRETPRVAPGAGHGLIARAATFGVDRFPGRERKNVVKESALGPVIAVAPDRDVVPFGRVRDSRGGARTEHLDGRRCISRRGRAEDHSKRGQIEVRAPLFHSGCVLKLTIIVHYRFWAENLSDPVTFVPRLSEKSRVWVFSWNPGVLRTSRPPSVTWIWPVYEPPFVGGSTV